MWKTHESLTLGQRQGYTIDSEVNWQYFVSTQNHQPLVGFSNKVITPWTQWLLNILLNKHQQLERFSNNLKQTFTTVG